MPLPADLSVRDLGPGDLQASVELMSRCHATYWEWAPAGWEPPAPEEADPNSAERLADPERWSRGAFDAEGRLVATLSSEQFKDPVSGETPGCRARQRGIRRSRPMGQGIATDLLSQGEQAMGEGGYRLARLWTPEGAPAHRFYEAHGWRHDGRRMWHDRFRLHHIGYEKRLMR